MSVVVLDDGHERLDRLVAALARQTWTGSWEVLVCGASGQEAELARRCAPLGGRVRLVLGTGTSTEQLQSAVARASGAWVNLCASTTVPSPDYLHTVASELAAETGRGVSLVTTHALVRDESRGRVSDSSPDRWRSGERPVRSSLASAPDQVPAALDGVLFEATRLRDATAMLTQDPAPSVVGLEIVIRYLLLEPAAVLLHVPAARFQRSTPEGLGPTVASPDAGDTRVYVDAWTRTLLPLVESASRQGGLPTWFRRLLLAEVFTRLRDDELSSSRSSSVSTDVLDVFHQAVTSVASHLDESDVWDFAMVEVPLRLRMAVLFGYMGATGQRGVRLSETETRDAEEWVRLEYYCRSALPEASGTPGGTVRFRKSQSIHLLGRELTCLRSFWVEAGDVVAVGDETYQIRPSGGAEYLDATAVEWSRRRDSRFAARPRLPKGPSAVLRRLLTREITWVMIWEEIGLTMPGMSRFSAVLRLLRQPVVDAISRGLWRVPRVRVRYDAGWLLVDRLDAAGDNAEHLARYLYRTEDRGPVRFGLERSSADWVRLRREGFDLVSPGTVRWNLALLGAEVLASSHVDRGIVEPLSPVLSRSARWRFVFLQHGVTIHDVSRWLNAKPIDLILTSAEAEFEAFVGDGSPFRYSAREVALTGMPRFDRLSRARTGTEHERRTLVVAPTWRAGLRDALLLDPTQAGLEDSEYWVSVRALLQSDQLAERAAAGQRIVFLPHPSMQPFLEGIRLPKHVETFRYAGGDVQQLLVETSILVTDYSSIAFDAAYAGARVVYYQFDREQMYSGGHLYREGYFDFERDGFGPVLQNLQDVLSLLDEERTRGSWGWQADDRASAFFRWQDDRNCKRSTDAIVARLNRRARG